MSQAIARRPRTDELPRAENPSRGGADKVIYYVMVFGGSALALSAAHQGAFGVSAKSFADVIFNAFKGLPGGAPISNVVGGAPITVGPGGISVAQPAGRPAASGSAAAMQAANPNFMSQMRTWQAERRAKGESPTDWAAFQAHEHGIGAPEPGGSPPPEFYT